MREKLINTERVVAGELLSDFTFQFWYFCFILKIYCTVFYNVNISSYFDFCICTVYYSCSYLMYWISNDSDYMHFTSSIILNNTKQCFEVGKTMELKIKWLLKIRFFNFFHPKWDIMECFKYFYKNFIDSWLFILNLFVPKLLFSYITQFNIFIM